MSNKLSYEEFNGDTTISFHTWRGKMPVSTNDDIQTAHFLKDSVTGFMESPVGLYRGKPITVKSRKIDVSVDSLLKLKDYLYNLNKDNPVFLHRVSYNPSFMMYKTLDENTLEYVDLDTPKLSEAFWIIRYATLNDEFEDDK